MPSPQVVLVAFVVFLAFLAAGLFLRYLVERFASPWAVHRNLPFSTATLKALSDFVPFWFALAGVSYGVRTMVLPEDVSQPANQAVRAALILSLAILALRLLAHGTRVYRERSEGAHSVGGIVERIGQVVVVAIAALMLFGTLLPEVDVTPLLTGLGVAGLATALALQDTLANFFAGLYLLADKPVRVGDFVKLDDGNEGHVLEVGWRSTRLRTLSNSVIVIPNQKLAQSVVVNHSLPETRVSLLMPVKVGYDADPERVQNVLLAVLNDAAGEVEGLLPQPAPEIRFVPGFGDTALEFTLVYQVREFVDQYRVQHELRLRILERFRQEGIEFPPSTRVPRPAASPPPGAGPARAPGG